MEYLRWILLAAGIVFILFIYLLGRNRRRRKDAADIEARDDVPEFSAQDWDDLDEGVGEVRIIARDTSDDYLDEPEPETEPAYQTEHSHEPADTFEADNEPPAQYEEVAQAEPLEQDETEPEQQRADNSNSDIIVLHILARDDQTFTGDRINSAAISSGLMFGNMNIYHRLDDYGQSVFGLANMVEPGSFDPVNMHDLRTPGLTMFMQLSDLVEAEDAFTDMLQVAYSLSELLDGQLCNRRRQPLTQSDAEQYRELVAGVDA